MNDNITLVVLQLMQGIQTLLSRTSRMQMQLTALQRRLDELAEMQGEQYDDDDSDESPFDTNTIMQFMKGLQDNQEQSLPGAASRTPRAIRRPAPPSIGKADVEKVLDSLKGGSDE